MNNNRRTYVLQTLLVMLMIMGANGVWGQVDYSGTYYIASGGLGEQNNNGAANTKYTYSPSDPSNNYYLCPTENWCYYKPDDDFSSDGTTYPNPFLTTYKCRSTAYHSGNASDAVWEIIKAPNSSYYYIIQKSTGKYLVSNGQIRTTDNPDRIRVHLEKITDLAAQGDKVLFNIVESTLNSSCIEISPIGITDGTFTGHGDHNKHRWLTVNYGNYNYLTGRSGKTGGPTGYTNTSGIVGIYAKADSNGPFYLEPAISIAPPTITNNNNSTFTITAAEGATIYYTTDGTTPTTSTTTTGTTSVNVNQTEEMTVIKAIAKATSDPFPTAVTTYNLPVCNRPVIKISGGTVTITCATEGAAIHYTIDGSHATASSTSYTGPFAKGSASEIRAIATKAGYVTSSEAALLPPTEVSSSSEITDMSGNYILTSDFTQSASIGSASEPFSGTIDGDMITLSGLRHPLVAYANDAIIKNVMLKGVEIDGSGSVGAIVGVAEGYSRIYNCGILPSDNKYENETSHVSSSDGYCGGLVGWLKDDSRVINCFSYANIEGGTDVAGIVGHVEAVYSDANGSYGSTTEVSSEDKYYRLRSAVVNCMFYGNITSGDNRYPVYGGAKMLNNTATGINNYDFYRAEATVDSLKDYNCSWPAKEEYLTQYEFYRYLLNSNRELCGWWVGAPSVPSTMTTTEVQAVPKEASLMAKWVLDPSTAPYPILKPAGKYFSVINQDPNNRINPDSKTWESRLTSSNTIMTKASPDTEGQKLGSVTVIINKGGGLSGSDSRTIPITAMDIDNNDFCYGKIQLPYYNSIFGDPNSSDWSTKYGGNYKDKVVVGWEITSATGDLPSITNNSDHTYSTNAESGYNFTDRYCTTKDGNRVFAQGGYYYVPYGVSDITITAKWATATYLDNNNHYYDCVSVSNYVYDNGLKTTVGSSTLHPFEPAGTRPALGNGEVVKNGSISDNLPSGSVYEKAIVLVGNHQYFTGGYDIGSAGKGCTIMSADFDLDDEPDNCLIWELGTKTNRYNICPIRFDFLPVVEMGLAMKEDGSTHYYALGCYRPLGHYEVTETSLIHFGQFEFGNSSRDKAAYTDPLILNGGIYDQYTKGTMGNDATKDYINYIIIGGNVRMPSFTPGAHPSTRDSAKKSTRHCPVNVMGGNIDNLYLSGNYNDNITPNTDNPHCYIDGGNFKQVAAAGKEGINGNVFFNINHSIIQEFYGGSTMDQTDGANFKIVKGNIDVTIDNSMVNKYCGGPKFGSMASGKTITTHATGTTFGVYYGGGNGGTSYVQYASTDVTHNSANASYSWEGDKFGNLTDYTPGAYYKKNEIDTKGIGYKADYEMEIVNASTGTVSNQGIFRTYFYAAQFSATNTGSVINNLTDCKVLTSFYGGGNLGGVIGDVTSTLTNTKVLGSAFGAGYSASVPEVTIYNKDKTAPTINVYTGIITPTPEGSGTSTTYTWTNETSLGNKTLSTSNPAVEDVDGKNYFYTEEPLVNLGSVTGNVILNITGTTTVNGSVYGGGEESSVGGDTKVNLVGGTVNGDVYGGGQGRLEVGTEGQEGYVAPIAATVGSTHVNLNGIEATDYDAEKFGSLVPDQQETPSHYTVADTAKGCIVKGDIFGCNNLNGTPKGSATVHVYKTQNVNASRITNPAEGEKTAKVKGRYDVKAVYGGGNLAPYEPDATLATGTDSEKEASKPAATVIIDGCDRTSIGQVYGGGNAASTPATNVTVNGSYEIFELFGGGNGKEDITYDGVNYITNPGANVGYSAYSTDYDPPASSKEERSTLFGYGSGKASVNVFGGTIHRVFGGSNTKGNVRQTAVTLLDENSDCGFCVDEAYGGGKSAPMDAEAKLLMACIPGLQTVYGGAEAADIQGNVTLNITNGTFDRVYGGNNLSGTINGSIIVNIEEVGCKPVIIGELYGGGNHAGYSVYGYDSDGKPVETVDPGTIPLYEDPQVNVMSFTSIGKIFGGGFGSGATMVGNPTVNINEAYGRYYNADVSIVGENAETPNHYPIPSHAKGKMGAISNVFGGGNEAKVIGNTNVNIGTLKEVYVVKEVTADAVLPDGCYTRNNNGTYSSATGTASADVTYYEKKAVQGVDIRGDVYGGGNNAEVTGDTHVTIGRKVETSTASESEPTPEPTLDP